VKDDLSRKSWSSKWFENDQTTAIFNWWKGVHAV